MVTPFLTNIVLTDEVGGASFKVCIEVYYHCEDRALVLMGHPGTINVGGKVTTRPARGILKVNKESEYNVK